ncbi:MAG: hypothetical protein QW786_00725 [Candidatus Hadarchaeum sp.]
MPRRKYGHMVGPLPQPPKPEKCRFCRSGRACPFHKQNQRPQNNVQS